MTWEQIVGLILAWLVMGIGFIGCILPVFPGTSLVLLASVAHRLYFGETGPSYWMLATLCGIWALSVIIDYLASMYGAKKLGATRRGIIGAVLGGTVGIFFSLPGILLGPFLGALILEKSGGREWKPAALAGLGALLGMLAGGIGKAGCCALMILLFTGNVIWRSRNMPGVEIAWLP